MKTHKTKAIVLKKVFHGEGNLIITFLTKEGCRLSSFAAGARKSKKRFNGSLDLFNCLEVEFQEAKNSDLYRLQHADLVLGMEAIRKDLLKFASSCYFTEMILEFLNESEHSPKIFKTFLEYLKEFNKPEAFPSHMIPHMEHHLLEVFGYKPHLFHCLHCQQSLDPQETYYFNGIQGGIFCKKCQKGKTGMRPVDGHPLSYSAIQQILKGHQAHPSSWRDQNWKPQDITETRAALEYFIQYTAGKPLKSLQFLSNILTQRVNRSENIKLV